MDFKRKEKPNKTEKTVNSLQSQQLVINSKVFKTSSLKVTKLDFNSQKKPSITENGRLQKEHHNALSELLITEKTVAPPPLNELSLLYYSSLSLQMSQNAQRNATVHIPENAASRLFICLSSLFQLWHNCQEKLANCYK